MPQLSCGKCERQGRYRKATLIDKYGGEAALPDLLRLVAADCPKKATRGNDLCGVHYVGLRRRRAQCAIAVKFPSTGLAIRGILNRKAVELMPDNRNSRPDPDTTLQHLRSRVLGGARPHLESLNRDEMVAAGELISRGEAEIASYSCRLFLIATLHDEPSDLGNLMAETKRFLRNL